LAWEVAEKRKVPKLSFKRSGFGKCDSEHDKMCYSKFRAKINRGYYKKKYTLCQKIYALGLHERMFYPRENRPNFFKVLYQNLTNKPNIDKEQKYDLRINYKHLV